MPIERLDGTVTGTLSTLQTVGGSVSEMGAVTGSVTVSGATDYPEYTGAYEIVPKVTEQTFDTAYKVMTADLTVTAIPYYETTNESGGYTAIIG